MGKYFGTDGIRGVANTVLTPELAYRLGRCGGHVLVGGAQKTPTVLIGRDTRRSGPMLEGALCAGLLSIGANVVRLGVVTTPAVAFLTRHFGADAGIMISASHNPMEDNGIKFFGRDGFKLRDETEHRIEQLLDQYADALGRPVGRDIGLVTDDAHAQWKYAQYIEQKIDVRLDRLRIVLDCAHGAAVDIAPAVFRALGAEVIILGNTPDGCNINAGCGSTALDAVREATVQHNAHIGIAFDGDADRAIAIDETGNVLDGDHLLAIFGKTMREKGKLYNNTIVTTVMANYGFFMACAAHGLHTVQTAVGDRYVVEAMHAGGYTLGGEQSGHIVFLDHATTGDGILTAVQLAAIVAETNTPLSAHRMLVRKVPQVLVNVVVEDKQAWKEDDAVQQAIDTVVGALGNRGRILVRESGTEPIVRVMIEGEDALEIESYAHKVAETIQGHVGSNRIVTA